MTKPDLTTLVTEARNPRTADLDRMSTQDLLQAMHEADQEAVAAVGRVLPQVTAALDAIAERMARGGRLLYVGAGTSGRLGVLDAAECPPTFSATADQVQGLIAGGPAAFLQAVEGAEDSPELGAADLRKLGLRAEDCVVGIAASGRTPYVLGALAEARERGALTVALVCNPDSPVAAAAALPIEAVTGPEVLTGSTRLKAGTATKLVLNMLSTGAFVRLHKVYSNLMVDVQATNQKLVARSRRIVQQATGSEPQEAEVALQRCQGSVKAAIVMVARRLEPAAAQRLLDAHRGSVRAALEAR